MRRTREMDEGDGRGEMDEERIREDEEGRDEG
jgi:hypothetical protein